MRNTPEGQLRGNLLLVSGEAEQVYQLMADNKEFDLKLLKTWLKDLHESINRYELEVKDGS